MSQEIIEWDLSSLYKGTDDPRIDKDIKEIEAKVKKLIEKAKGNLNSDLLTPTQLKEWFEYYEEASTKAFYLNLYSGLIYSITSLDDEVKALKAKIDDFSTKMQQETLFFNLELNQISEERFKELVNSPVLSNYKHEIEYNRLEKAHQLSESEEQIVLMKDLTGRKGFRKLYSEITSGFTYEFDVDGEKKTMTGSELFSLMYHTDKDVRYNALQTYISEYKNNELTFTHIYNNILKDWVQECERRKFKTPIAKRNLENEVDDDIVETLGKVTTKSNTIVEKYYNIKKKILKLPELKMSDIYAPVGEVSKKYSYKEAVELIKDANQNFSPKFREIVEKMVEQEHIDVTPRKGKVEGAFCSYGKMNEYPYVFLNFTGTVDSVLTLAHELGHAIHHYLIQQKQTFTNIGSSLPVAEIASVFNEIVAFDFLIKQDLSKKDKIALLANHIEGNFSTSHRQNAFYRYEKHIHNLIKEKLPTTDDFKESFAKEMELMFGNSITNIKEDYESYCFVVPHFIDVPFYVYAYNMSNLLVIALYQLYLEQKEKFIPKFIDLLSVGKSMTPAEMLARMGIDLTDSTFWHKGIDYLSRKIDELEELIN
ncbi:MAG: M3 family oligoendopeptidase [Asgard group archaeon]|nr:M3 family oligoendopeptidase [Asgard group archaeon]